MNVKDAERRLLVAAKNYGATGDASQLLISAIDYGKAKFKARQNRDRWKRRKRLNEGTSNVTPQEI